MGGDSVARANGGDRKGTASGGDDVASARSIEVLDRKFTDT